MEAVGAYEVVEHGPPLAAARGAMIMAHGRGATARDILTLVPEIMRPELTYLALQAPGNEWYPFPFTAPLRPITPP